MAEVTYTGVLSNEKSLEHITVSCDVFLRLFYWLGLDPREIRYYSCYLLVFGLASRKTRGRKINVNTSSHSSCSSTFEG